MTAKCNGFTWTLMIFFHFFILRIILRFGREIQQMNVLSIVIMTFLDVWWRDVSISYVGTWGNEYDWGAEYCKGSEVAWWGGAVPWASGRKAVLITCVARSAARARILLRDTLKAEEVYLLLITHNASHTDYTYIHTCIIRMFWR